MISPSGGCCGVTAAAYVCQTDVAGISVPATLQATIGARIDRLGSQGQAHVEGGGGDRVAF